MINLDTNDINKLIEESHSSPRKRSAKSMHSPEHNGPRALAVCLQPESYMIPHMHPAQHGEILMHIRGDMCLFVFDVEGNVIETHRLSDKSLKVVEIPPKTYHTVMALTKDSLLFEVSQGPYNAENYKKSAAWAPDEKDTELGQAYWKKLSLLCVK